MRSYFMAPVEVKTQVPLIEVTKSSLILLFVDLGLEKVLEAGDFGLMVFTKSISGYHNLGKLSQRRVLNNMGGF